MLRAYSRSLRFLIAAIALLLAAAVPASADPLNETTETAPFQNPNGSHCVIHLQAKNKDAPEGQNSGAQAKPVCYSTATEAIRDATGGAVTDAPANLMGSSAEVKSQLNAYNSKAGKVKAAGGVAYQIAGVVHQLPTYEGDSYYISIPETCSNQIVYRIDFTGTWWDNRTSSVMPLDFCIMQLYQFQFYGTSFWADNPEPYLGDFDNRTTSIEFYSMF